MGWKVINTLPEVPKCVLAIAPHTSNWDFIVGKLAYNTLNRQANFLIKEEWFVFPLNLFFSSIGGIPVKRERNDSLTSKLTDEFKKREWMHLGITPEGTRKPVQEWKKGFYFIALNANVPIILVGFFFIQHPKEKILKAIKKVNKENNTCMVQIIIKEGKNHHEFITRTG